MRETRSSCCHGDRVGAGGSDSDWRLEVNGRVALRIQLGNLELGSEGSVSLMIGPRIVVKLVWSELYSRG